MKSMRLLASIAAFGLTLVTASAAAPVGWTEDYTKAVEKAKEEKKNILLDFTGSDWCGWCMKIDKEVFDKPKFKSFAKDSLVLVKVDFPHSKPQSAKIKKQNSELQGKYEAKGFPTLVIVDPEGKELWRQRGYAPGGPEAFIDSVKSKLK